MLTGDNQKTAQAVSRRFGLDQVFAGVLPDQKVDVIRRLQTEGKIVAILVIIEPSLIAGELLTNF